MWMREVCVEDGKYSVSAQVIRCGKDVSLTIGGGESPHIGAGALAIPRPSLRDSETVSASTSVICVPGHKEDEVARAAAQRIASAMNCVVNVCVGVHIDNADRDELMRLKQNLDKLIDLVLKELEES